MASVDGIPRTLANVRILSLALNLPGPAALMRCRAMGAVCVKLEAPGLDGASSDPMARYAAHAYAALHDGVMHRQADLKTSDGQATLAAELELADVVLTSFRPSALTKLGLGWEALHARHPGLSMVTIVGGTGADAEIPGHDLTYLAENGLVPGLELPATLYADMTGALMASEAMLQAVLHRTLHGTGIRIEVALSEAARHLAMPRAWGLTQPAGAVGGAHAGYRVYPCIDGRVAVAALEPHFSQRLCIAAGLGPDAQEGMFRSSTHAAIAAFLASVACEEIEILARSHDLPLLVMRD